MKIQKFTILTGDTLLKARDLWRNVMVLAHKQECVKKTKGRTVKAPVGAQAARSGKK
ncbi:hypothetical protein [Scardovia inopinata]|uniref:hypothetical protein n=1 Tax=Scardovia inopinata TaxID=78259 RepID=UPI0001D09E3D|nr:hypothetical protein [Scardovia inopinata]BAR07394.1 hypothetical protein SCIP_1327 [Scardovia inopinata JCM 12537]